MPKPAMTRVPNLQISPSPTNNNNGLSISRLTTVQRDKIPSTTLIDGWLIYNTTVNLFQVYQSGAWYSLNAALSTLGTGLVAGIPTIIGIGTRVAVEVITNEEPGFLYYDTTNAILRIRLNAAWADA